MALVWQTHVLFLFFILIIAVFAIRRCFPKAKVTKQPQACNVPVHRRHDQPVADADSNEKLEETDAVRMTESAYWVRVAALNTI
ncbi:MAG: hypothetical protein J0H37_02180 [Hyphomicrobium denitrificans]|nr:hypothetical protein [Hyphomicrobium denitrificans]